MDLSFRSIFKPPPTPCCQWLLVANTALRSLSSDLLDPDERVVKLWIYGLQIFESQRFVQDALVEGEGETCVDEFAMEQGLERNNAQQLLSFEFYI